nr:hypothetical protein Iba_chr02bCG13360 [Ipomoea batatas]
MIRRCRRLRRRQPWPTERLHRATHAARGRSLGQFSFMAAASYARAASSAERKVPSHRRLTGFNGISGGCGGCSASGHHPKPKKKVKRHPEA